MVDWRSLTLTISDDNDKTVIQGDPTLTRAEVTLKKLKQSRSKQDQRFLVELRALTTHLQGLEIREKTHPQFHE